MIPPDVQERYRRSGAWGTETLPARTGTTASSSAARIAWIDGDVRLTFAEAGRLIERLAGHLVTLGIAPGDAVAWQLPNWWEAAIVHHAALRAGATPVPVPPTMREPELRGLLGEVQPDAFVVPHAWRGFDHAEIAATLAAELEIPHVITVRGAGPGTELSTLLETDAPAPRSDGAPDDLALVLYTSGTSSAPKGVQHTHRGLLCEVESFREIHRLTPSDRYLCGPPVTHIAGLAYGILAPMALGTSAVLLDRWDPERGLDAVARDGATFMTGPPVFLLSMAGRSAGPLPGFRLYSTGGATIHEPAIREAASRLGCVVKRAYGSTEVPTLTAGRLDDEEAVRLGTDGRTIGAGEVRIVEGEIWARAPEMFVGYRSASPGAAAFEPDGWFRTGDLGSVDDAGNLRVTGRLKDIIIRGGENISALELEELLSSHPAIDAVAVIGVPDALLGERVCAVVQARATVSLDEVAQHLRARGVATFKLPERLEIVDRMPLNANGKVRKHELRARLAQGT